VPCGEKSLWLIDNASLESGFPCVHHAVCVGTYIPASWQAGQYNVSSSERVCRQYHCKSLSTWCRCISNPYPHFQAEIFMKYLNTHDVVETGISCHHERNDAVICYPKLELETQHVL